MIPADHMPYWITLGSSARLPESFGVSPGVVAYAVLLAGIAAAIIGVLPALQATGKRMQAGLQQVAARSAGMQLGRTWTVLIVLQVAFAVATLPAALYYAMMSFTVAKRRREIGIRSALGADSRQLLMGIFGRASAQIGAGIAVGLVGAAAVEKLAMGGRGYVFLPVVAGIMMTVGLPRID